MEFLKTAKIKPAGAIALLLASIPTLRWYALRLQDGGGEVAGLVPLVAALWFWFRDRKGLRAASWEVWLAAILLLIQAAAYPFLPPILRAVLMVAAVVCFSGLLRRPGIVCLLVLALPWKASLDFFLGYPLRLLTSINGEFLLNFAGMDVNRAGVQLLYGERVVGVDPACSGMNMLWSTGLLTALLAAVFSLRWRGVVMLGIVALMLAMVGNSFRAAILFFPEADLVEMPHLLHAGIGIAITGVCFLFLMKLARRLSIRRKVGNQDVINAKPAVVSCLIIGALLVVLASFCSVRETHQSMGVSRVLTSYRGYPITRISLTPAEEIFYGKFPGSIAVYEGADFKLIVRVVDRATRKLHPASHCLRAEGFRIGEKTVQTKNDERWLYYKVARNSETFQVRERVTCSGDNQSWTEISAWYWFALFYTGEGPWEAQTVIRSL